MAEPADPAVRRKHIRNRWIFGALAVLVIAAGLLLTPSKAQRLEPGPLFDLTDSVSLPTPHDLHDTEGSWQVLTVNAYPLTVVDEVILQFTGRSDELYRAATAGESDSHPREEARAARQNALNVAMDTLTNEPGLLVLEDTEGTDVPSGSRLLSVDGSAPTAGQVPAGEWFVVEPGGQYATHTVGENSATAHQLDPRERVSYQVPLPEDADAVGTVAFDMGEAGGSSAGLATTLAWVDALTEGDLTGGRDIAATGAITPDGGVVPVAGVQFKLQAAAEAQVDLVLVPAEYDGPVPEGLNVVRVANIDEALDAVAE